MGSHWFRLPLFPRWVRAALVVAVMATILYFSIIPVPGGDTFRTGPLGVVSFSTWMHLLAYGGLALVLAYALHDSSWPEWVILFVVFLIAVGYGAAVEIVQAAVPERTYSHLDMIVNAVGAAIAVGVWRAVVRYVRFYRLRKLEQLQPPLE